MEQQTLVPQQESLHELSVISVSHRNQDGIVCFLQVKLIDGMDVTIFGDCYLIFMHFSVSLLHQMPVRVYKNP